MEPCTRYQTKNFEIGIFDDKTGGWFEHNTHGDELGGGLWFMGRFLVDYDGVWSLPQEVASKLLELGYEMED